MIRSIVPGTGTAADQSVSWHHAAAWLLVLGPFFFISYGIANWVASQNSYVPNIVFAWEQYIPFIPWTIFPYWVIDILYAISLFICTTRLELDSHAKRLLTTQIIAVTCFIVLPLEFTFERPETTGLAGRLFTTLSSFDRPYNQAPSLHIALLVILWALYVRHLPRILLWPFHILSALICISVLTTYQHHFIDIPTGALLGWFSVWLWPLDKESMMKQGKVAIEPRRLRLAAYYMLGALTFTTLAFQFGGLALWLLWPAVSLLLVASCYIYYGSSGFQKNGKGKLSVASKWLMYPYLLAARVNSRFWTRRDKKAVSVCDGVYLGRFPSRNDVNGKEYSGIVDLTAEFEAPATETDWHSIPHLDLLTPGECSLVKASDIIERLQGQGDVLVACALGYSRSALAVIAWLIRTERVDSIDEAIDMVRSKRRAIVINEEDIVMLASLTQQ